MGKHAQARGTLAVGFALIAPPAGATDWDWRVAPYGWAPSISTDIKTRSPPSSSSIDTEFGDIVDKIDGAFQAHLEGQGDRWGMLADLTFLSLADDSTHPRYRTASDLDTRLFEIAVIWSPGTERFKGIEVIAGLRYIDVDLTVELTPANPAFPPVVVDAGDSFNDVMLGARYSWAISERWGVTVRGDGSLGDTEGTWSASAIAQYGVGKGAWLLGYRHLDIELETRSSETNLALSGPLVGYVFRF